jgi:hypothetical protein
VEAAALGIPEGQLTAACGTVHVGEYIMRYMSEHREWEIAVTPREEAPLRWRALIEVWPPGTSWRTHAPRVVLFTQSAVSREEILKAAKLHAEEWINSQR